MVASKTNYVCTLSKAQAEQLHGLMEERGWEFDSAPYAYWRGKKDKTNVVAYESGKLTVQGAYFFTLAISSQKIHKKICENY